MVNVLSSNSYNKLLNILYIVYHSIAIHSPIKFTHLIVTEILIWSTAEKTS